MCYELPPKFKPHGQAVSVIVRLFGAIDGFDIQCSASSNENVGCLAQVKLAVSK